MMPHCNLCGSAENHTLEAASDGVKTLRCAQCGLIRLSPFPALPSESAHYNEEYYKPWQKEEAQRAALWRRRLKLLEQHKKPGTLLDVGCGDGAFLKTAKNSGWTVTGTEVSDWAATKLQTGLDIDVKIGDLPLADWPEKSFDAITMWHVLEHTRDPLANLQKILTLLKDDGVFIMAVPNAHNHIFRMFYPLARGKFLSYYTPGARELHLHHFTEETLRLALEKAGFRVLRIGIDRSALGFGHKVLEWLAVMLYGTAGLNWSEALEAVAVKK